MDCHQVVEWPEGIEAAPGDAEHVLWDLVETAGFCHVAVETERYACLEGSELAVLEEVEVVVKGAPRLDRSVPAGPLRAAELRCQGERVLQLIGCAGSIEQLGEPAP